MQSSAFLGRVLGWWGCYAAGGLLSLAAAPGGTPPSTPAASVSTTSTPGPPADPVVVVRLSERLFTPAFTEPLNTITDVQEDVLGVRFAGQAENRGDISLRLDPAQNEAAFEIVVQGTSTSATVGEYGPAILHATSRTVFSATKVVLLSADRGFVGRPARLVSRTTSGVETVASKLPGIRGSIVNLVAWRRVRATQCQADQIAARLADQRIIAAVNARAEPIIAALNLRWYVIEPAIRLLREDSHYVLHFATTKSYLQVAVRHAQAVGPPEVPAIDVSPYVIQVWLHPSLVPNDRVRNPNAVLGGKAIREGVEESIRIALTGSAEAGRIPTEFRYVGSWPLLSLTLDPDQFLVATKPSNVNTGQGKAAKTVR